MEPRIYRGHPLNRHLDAGGVSKQNSHPLHKSNAKMLSMRFFVWWSYMYLMHHTPIKLLIM